MPSAVAPTTPVVLPQAPSVAVPGTLTVALWGPMVAAARATVRRLRSEPSTVLMEQKVAHAVADPRQVSVQRADVVSPVGTSAVRSMTGLRPAPVRPALLVEEPRLPDGRPAFACQAHNDWRSCRRLSIDRATSHQVNGVSLWRRRALAGSAQSAWQHRAP